MRGFLQTSAQAVYLDLLFKLTHITTLHGKPTDFTEKELLSCHSLVSDVQLYSAENFCRVVTSSWLHFAELKAMLIITEATHHLTGMLILETSYTVLYKGLCLARKITNRYSGLLDMCWTYFNLCLLFLKSTIWINFPYLWWGFGK